jgi:hypothetical protein
MVSAIDDRLYAQINGMLDAGVIDEQTAERVSPLWIKSFRAWASDDPLEHENADKEINEWRKSYSRNSLPFTKTEMESIPQFTAVLPTWKSLGYDYLSDMAHFNKKWLAIFGETDRVVPTEESVKNIKHYMSLSGNNNYNIAIIPRMGHVPVDAETKRRIDFDYLIINWLYQNIVTPN